MLLIKGWRKQAVANRDRLVETIQQQQANNQEQEQEQANNQEQEQENNFGIEPPRAWETTQDSYPESVALLRQAFQRKGIVNEESLQQLALWLVRSQVNWSDWGYDSEKQARAAWKRNNVLKEEVDYPRFVDTLRRFIYELTPSWQSR